MKAESSRVQAPCDPQADSVSGERPRAASITSISRRQAEWRQHLSGDRQTQAELSREQQALDSLSRAFERPNERVPPLSFPTLDNGSDWPLDVRHRASRATFREMLAHVQPSVRRTPRS